MRFFLVLCAVTVLCNGCTTLSNRRDLYNPSEDAGPYHSLPPAHPSPSANSAPAQQAPLPPGTQ